MDYLKRAKAFRTKKRLGQNFLIDGNIIKTIINEANLTQNDTVLEIGAGLGFVTEQLATNAKKVFAVEIDLDAINKLVELPYQNIEIINKDILKVNLAEYLTEPVKIVANIPYYITTPILVHLIGEIDDMDYENKKYIKEIFLMVQYEVAKRIIADEKSPSKDYGLLSVLSNYWCETELITKVPAKCFYPAPKVDSAVIKLTIRKEPLIKSNNPTLFRKVIKTAFNTRRKNIKNSLLKAFSSDVITQALNLANIETNRRPETISMQEFNVLTAKIETLMKENKNAK